MLPSWQIGVLNRAFAVTCLLVAGCGSPGGGTVSLVLDVPNGMLDPKGYTSVEVRLHKVDGSTSEINVAVTGGAFDLGTIDPTDDVFLEAALRSEGGAAVGYGRGATAVNLRDDETVTVPIRRPIVYFSGLASDDPDPNTDGDRTWSKTKPTFYDLSAGTVLDGSTQLQANAVFTVSAGPRLFVIDQTPTSPSDMLVLTGAPTIREVSTADHTVASTPLSAMLDGGVADAAGTDDGSQLVIATSTHLFVVDTTTGAAKPIADGNFSRVAIVTSGDRAVTAIAIKNRALTGCTAELVFAATNSDDTNQVMSLGTSGYTDVAGDSGHGYYVDECKGGELGEATASAAIMKRTGLGKPTALAVINGLAWIGIEQSSGVLVQSAPVATTDEPRTVFNEDASQVVEASDDQGTPLGVLRRLDPVDVHFQHLEIGAGGDYVAWTLAATYHGDAVFDANVPEMDIQTDELRVADTSSGALIMNYRSTCEGSILVSFGDIPYWFCSLSPGQVEAGDLSYFHRISAMTFQFGNK